MKKEWKKPELEVLDVNKTMHGVGGMYTDAGFNGNNHPKKPPNS